MELTKQAIEAQLTNHGIPPGMWGGITRYLLQHIRPGTFLQAVFLNDFHAAVMRADVHNQVILKNYAIFMYNEMPSLAWGSPAKVEAWLKQGADHG